MVPARNAWKSWAIPQSPGSVFARFRGKRIRGSLQQILIAQQYSNRTSGHKCCQSNELRKSNGTLEPWSNIVARALHRAGVVSPFRGAHVLRHSAATEMLRQGVSLQGIGAVLRHRSIETTAHYAKVDVALLRLVAQPWPEVTSC